MAVRSKLLCLPHDMTAAHKNTHLRHKHVLYSKTVIFSLTGLTITLL